MIYDFTIQSPMFFELIQLSQWESSTQKLWNNYTYGFIEQYKEEYLIHMTSPYYIQSHNCETYNELLNLPFIIFTRIILHEDPIRFNYKLNAYIFIFTKAWSSDFNMTYNEYLYTKTTYIPFSQKFSLSLSLFF